MQWTDKMIEDLDEDPTLLAVFTYCRAGADSSLKPSIVSPTKNLKRKYGDSTAIVPRQPPEYQS